MKKIGLLLLVPLLLPVAGCGDDDPVDPGDSACTITGTITDLGGDNIYEGGTYQLFLDVDPIWDNENHVGRIRGTFPKGPLAYTMDISKIMPNTYYLHMVMDLGGGAFPVGYYGADPMPWDIPPEPNAEVSCGAVLDFFIFD